MLWLVDHPKKYGIMRVVAVDGVPPKRQRIGFLLKGTLEVTPDVAEQLSPAENQELMALLDTVRSGIELRRRADALNLPQSLREALEYVVSGATDTERKLIINAIRDAALTVRKLERPPA